MPKDKYGFNVTKVNNAAAGHVRPQQVMEHQAWVCPGPYAMLATKQNSSGHLQQLLCCLTG